MPGKKIIIGSRGSNLALVQAEIIKSALLSLGLDLKIEVKIIKTHGDKNLSPIPLDTIGKGWFTKEIEKALISKEIDLAVHSLKDLPEKLPEGLTIGAITKREDPRDVLVSKNNFTLEKLPKVAVIGTDSLRRKLQFLHLRPDLIFESIRGNVQTRLKKLKEENFDGIILAAAGLDRLGLQKVITQYFDPTVIIPSPGQGALAIETRISDSKINQLVKLINDLPSEIETSAERIFAATIGGGCKLPVGAYAVKEDGLIVLYGMIASLDGKIYIQEKVQGSARQIKKLAALLAERVLKKFNG